MHMSKGTSAWDQLSTDSAQLLLCDLQPQIVARSKTIEADALGKSAEVLLEVARLFSLPTTLSVVPEGDKAPELISELQRFCSREAARLGKPVRAGCSKADHSRGSYHHFSRVNCNQACAGFHDRSRQGSF
jgi:hypothetical protein